VESDNGAVIRKRLGWTHIASQHAEELQCPVSLQSDTHAAMGMEQAKRDLFHQLRRHFA